MNKKILQISPYAFNHLGGVEKHAGILQKLFNDEMYTLSGGVDFPIIEPVKHCPLPCFWNKGFFNIFKTIRKDSTKLIISHIRFAPTAWLAFIIAKSRNIPYVHIEHGSNFLIHNNPFIQFIAKIADLTIGNIIIRNADYVICVSNASKEWVFDTFGRKENISTIYRGFDFNPIERQKNIIPRIGFVGRLTGYKNTDGLIKSLKKIEDKEWLLDIVGEGEERKNLETLVNSLNLKNKVNFLGAKDHDWVMNMFYPKTDIIVNSSFIECLGTTIIEALGMGCNVVATNRGGSPEIPGAYLVEPNEDGLMKGILHYLENFNNNGNNNILVIEKFSLDNMKINFNNVFSKFDINLKG